MQADLLDFGSVDLVNIYSVSSPVDTLSMSTRFIKSAKRLLDVHLCNGYEHAYDGQCFD